MNQVDFKDKIIISNSTILIITFCALLLLVYGVIETYDFTLKTSKTSHQNKQQEIVKSAGLGIKSNIEHLVNDLKLFAELNSLDSKEKKIFLDRLFTEGLESIFVVDNRMEFVFNEGEKLSNWIKQDIIKFYSSLDTLTNIDAGYYWVSNVKPKDQSFPEHNFIFLLLIEYPDESLLQKDYSKSSFIGCVVNFDSLITKYITPHKLTENDFVWVMDGEGRLIFHPNHREMLLRSTKDLSEDCTDCHKSFEIQNNMLVGSSSTGEYYIEGEPKKIMAYTPVHFHNQKWILAISTYLPNVIENVRNSFLFVFALAGAFIALLLILGYIAYYINLNRIRAVESQKHLQQVQNFQEKLNHAAKLASIGELVDSVAHEINTPTGIISSTADVLLLDECAQNRCSNDLRIIKDQTRRIGKYTKSLLRFSRRMPFQPELNDVIELINECIFIVNPKLRTNRINILQNVPNEFPKFTFDRGRLEQVIINLLNNAIDFVEHDGSITIKLEQYVTDGWEWAFISVADNGKGIPSENLELIFEPFFSTKPLTEGTGLGLSISKAIIERHEGILKVKSDPNGGTEFLIHLPMRKVKGEDAKQS